MKQHILSDNTLVLEELNNFFQSAINNSDADPVDKASNTYKDHPSILLIKQKL